MFLKMCIVHVELELDRKEEPTRACVSLHCVLQTVMLIYSDPRRYSMGKGFHFLRVLTKKRYRLSLESLGPN